MMCFGVRTLKRTIEKLQVSLDDVIVDREVKDIVKQLLSLANFRPKSTSHKLLKLIRISGALLYGPPGTGKTHLSRAIAKDFGINMVAITSADVVSKWVGDTDKYIKAAFSLSTKLVPCVLFIDEVDSLFSRRTASDRRHERSAINQFLQEMDGLATSENAPFVLVATNRPMDLDEAFLRRLPQKVLFTLPSEHKRGEILKTFLKESDISPLVSIDALSKATGRFSGSDLRSLCGQAALIFATEQVNAQPVPDAASSLDRLVLEPRHFAMALARTMPSVSQQAIDDIEEFAREFSSQTAWHIGQHITSSPAARNSYPFSVPPARVVEIDESMDPLVRMGNVTEVATGQSLVCSSCDMKVTSQLDAELHASNT
jgi:SpoVK/Ycf46/Vps4 family AAA+-type ATPase